MGNHEWCVECEESDFHYGRDCNPIKKAKVAAKNAQQKRECMNRHNKLIAALDKGGFEYWVGEGLMGDPVVHVYGVK